MGEDRADILVLDTATYQFIESFNGLLIKKEVYESLCSKWKALSIVKKHSFISYQSDWKIIWLGFYKLDMLYNSFYCFNLKNKDPEMYNKLQDEDFKRKTLSAILGEENVKIINRDYQKILNL